MPRTFSRWCLVVSIAALLVLLASLGLGLPHIAMPAALACMLCLAVGLGSVPALKGYRFTAWILVAVTAGMLYPTAFLRWGNIDLRNKWLILATIQVVMFGMGTQMKLQDFMGIVKAPRGVLVGLVCQFTVMPFVGYGLTRLFHFPNEIAAGIILIGCCSSGLASNVMTYLAKGNLVLSVTVTAITTLVAPFMTPLLMKLLAGTLVEVKFTVMMLEIIKMVIVPIGAALLHDYLKSASPKAWKLVRTTSLVALLLYAALALGLWGWLSARLPETAMTGVELLAFLLGAVLFGHLYHKLTLLLPRLDSFMPVGSMAGIVYFTTVTTAAGRDNLLQVGLLLFFASVLHNAAGYFFGYWLSLASGLDKQSARSVAFEVGLQNGGMASGLAGSMGKLGTMGLAAAIFSPWMNISGSILANYWKRKPAPGP